MKTAKKEEGIKFPLSQNAIRLRCEMNEIYSAVAICSKPIGFFKQRIDKEALIEVSRQAGIAKADFWCEVYRKYPELKGKDASSDFNYVWLI